MLHEIHHMEPFWAICEYSSLSLALPPSLSLCLIIPLSPVDITRIHILLNIYPQDVQFSSSVHLNGKKMDEREREREGERATHCAEY